MPHLSFFVRKLDLLAKMFFGEIQVVGLENLDLIKPAGTSRGIIFATTHISGFDVQLAGLVVGRRLERIYLAADMDLVCGWSKPLHRLGGFLAGEANLLPVHYTGKGKNKRNNFQPRDFSLMKTKLGEGASVVMAAYLDRKAIWHLPEKGGVGAVYLAHITDNTLIIPVAVNVLWPDLIAVEGSLIKTALIKPPVKIIIGRPLVLKPISDIDLFADLVVRNHQRGILTGYEKSLFRAVKYLLYQQSDILMLELAKLLPEIKRGPWCEKICSSKYLK